MLAFLRYYASGSLQKWWIEASELATIGAGKGSYFGRQLRSWVMQYVASTTLPLLLPVQFKRSMVDDEDFKNDIKMHLQAQGKWVKAAHIVEFLQQEEVKQKYGLTKAISECTARRWMHEMAYRYGRERNGQYVDGHEREDVVEYQKNVFLKRWDEFESRMLLHDGEGKVVQVPKLPNFPHTLRVEQVAHDESTFYAHDQRKTRWIPEGESPIPAKKGEGISLMASDFCSPSLGWLRSPDGSREARLLFRAGKNRDGWFDSEDILQQTDLAIDLFEENFPLGNVIGLFCFDNAPSHQKRAPDALSARRMPKGTKFWPKKVPDNYVRMRAGKLPNGAQQDFWYPDDHPNKELARKFKGMKIILKERGRWPNTTPEPKAECDGFNCPPGWTDCCTRRLLWSESDFANQKSALQELVEARGHLFPFYPKYHCELNFIEQCWGKAKYEYCMYTMPKTEVELERNVRMALDSVTVPMMRRFANRSARFMDAYRKGLLGAEAAWANKKYRGHCVLPHNVILEIQNGL
ncbi:hypothetical protein M407DRAFT_69583 [Tulasnella calospora MUT 4182]|uniref:Uncharacterized protein n=1 Tax=Tulasnella calospora MUT 4182 TaxID=1051891 RepID=A0A0C3M8P4_9AGAM|nr:hypothetical protein M407DRAFT_69583 [Tulasnella calospora MUT 4182]